MAADKDGGKGQGFSRLLDAVTIRRHEAEKPLARTGVAAKTARNTNR